MLRSERDNENVHFPFARVERYSVSQVVPTERAGRTPPTPQSRPLLPLAPPLAGLFLFRRGIALRLELAQPFCIFAKTQLFCTVVL
jgi:hypothetical protein